MPSALSVIGAVTLITVGAVSAYWWDRHPPLGWHAHVLFWKPGIDLPDSLLTQRDKALSASQVAIAASGRCQAAITQQNLDLANAADLDASTVAAVRADLRSTKDEVASLRRSAASLKVYQPQGADVCSRWADADRMVKIMLGTTP